MPSIAQTILDKYNGVVDSVQSTISDAADKGIAALHKKVPVSRPPLTEAQVRDKNAMRSYLQKGIWIIHFDKADGTPTFMEATLDPTLMPAQTIFAGAERKKAPVAEHLLAVYSPDRGGWRSFLVANVVSMGPKL